MEVLFLVGRILYGGFFVMSGMKHFMQLEGMKQYAIAKGVPMPAFAVPATGLMIILGGLGILLGVYITCSVALITIFLIGVSFKMHNFWAITDPNMKAMEMVNFTKNIALLGAALMTLMISEPWAWSLF